MAPLEGPLRGGHVGDQVANHVRRFSRTAFRPTVTIRDMSRKWPRAHLRCHIERVGASVSRAETPQRKDMQQPALARCRKMLRPSVA